MKKAKQAGLEVVIALALSGQGCSRAQFEPIADAAVPDLPVSPEVGKEAPSAGPDVTGPPDAAVPCAPPPILGCSPIIASTCDPVCQRGDCDWCTQKCSYVYATASGGQTAACAPMGTGVFPQSCELRAAGSSQQSDDCAPGSICLAPTIGDDPTYCFTLCRVPADCPYGVACATRKLSAAGGQVAVCDPPYDQCGPDGTCCDPLANSGCGPNRVCLLVSPDLGTRHSRTVCEFSYGDGRDGAPCASARDCLLRNTCVSGACRQVCSETAPCPGSATCVALGSEFGYCA